MTLNELNALKAQALDLFNLAEVYQAKSNEYRQQAQQLNQQAISEASKVTVEPNPPSE